MNFLPFVNDSFEKRIRFLFLIPYNWSLIMVDISVHVDYCDVINAKKIVFFLDFYVRKLVGDRHERLSGSRSHPGHGQRMVNRDCVRGRIWQPFLASATDLHRKSRILLRQQSHILGYVGRHARRHQW